MPKKLAVAALVLAASLVPAVAGSGGCDHERQANMSCATGQTWDAATAKCVTVGS